MWAKSFFIAVVLAAVLSVALAAKTAPDPAYFDAAQNGIADALQTLLDWGQKVDEVKNTNSLHVRPLSPPAELPC